MTVRNESSTSFYYEDIPILEAIDSGIHEGWPDWTFDELRAAVIARVDGGWAQAAEMTIVVPLKTRKKITKLALEMTDNFLEYKRSPILISSGIRSLLALALDGMLAKL